VRRMLKRHRRDVAGIVAMVVLGVVSVGYVLVHQVSFHAPSWVPLLATSYYTVNAEFQSAQAVVPGQGQTVDVAGVQVGYVAGVRLHDGLGLVTLNLEHKYAPIYKDATLLLRPRTPLKDMYVSLYPGTRAAGKLPSGGTLGVGQTEPDVNVGDILNNLDTDAREYLQLLLGVGSQALRDPGFANGTPSPAAVSDLRETFKRFSPLARDTRALTYELALRRENLRRVIGRFALVARSLNSVDSNLASLVDVADRSFAAIAGQDGALAAAVRQLPSALAQTGATLGKVSQFENQFGPALAGLEPLARGLAPSLAATRPFLRETAPVIAGELRPFARQVGPVVGTLRGAAANLQPSIPALTQTLGVVNEFFNALAYNPLGPQNSFSFWGAWLSHIGTSLVGLQDGNGAIVRSLLGATCAQLDALHEVQIGNPQLGPILDLANLPNRLTLCPEDKVPGVLAAGDWAAGVHAK
jgi:phospholipid/cholesterol/gamma-HCH transport system substrate-binding protein